MSGAPVVLVVGVGRSGTSLAMQALQRLGARVSDQLVPPTPQNRRGPLEDLRIRDEMEALKGHLRLSTGPRPDSWREAVATRQAEDWLAEHLARAHVTAETPYAVKFPLASLFLPIWRDAAARVGVPLRPVWATRRAGAVIASFGLAYGTPPRAAAAHHAQRTFYLLQDAPNDTLLLPYEGWRTGPAEQIAALAEVAGLPPPGASGHMRDVYYPEEDRSGGDEAAHAPFPPALKAVDAALAERLGTLGGTIDEVGRSTLLSRLEALLMLDDETDEGRAAMAAVRDDVDASPPTDPLAQGTGPVAILRGERDRLRVNVLELRRERDALRERTDEALEARLASLRRAYEALSHERDLADLRLADLFSRHATALAAAEQRRRKTSADVKRWRERHNELKEKGRTALEAARADGATKARREERIRKCAEIEVLRAQLDEARASLAEHTALVERMGSSTRWRMGDAVAEAVRSPGRGTLALPYRLIRLWRGRPN